MGRIGPPGLFLLRWQGMTMSGKTCRMLSLAVAISLPATAKPLVGQATLVVLNSGDSQVALVDPATQRVVARFPTGPDPREVALSPDGRFAYITSYGFTGEPPSVQRAPGDVRDPEDPEEGGEAARYGASVRLGASAEGAPGRGDPPVHTGGAAVTVLDLVARRVHAAFHPGPYRNLHGIIVGSDGRRLWMTAEADSGIVELDAHTGALLMLWKTGGAKSHTLTLSADNRRIYVANAGSDAITVIDRVTVVEQRIPAGRNPEGLVLSRTGRELWVANRGDHTISIIDTRRLREIARFPSGGREPVRLQFNPVQTEMWVANRASRSLTVLDVSSAAVLATIQLDEEPRSLAFSADGAKLFVSTPRSGAVVVIDALGRAPLGSVRTGAGPHGLAWSEGGRRAAGSP